MYKYIDRYSVIILTLFCAVVRLVTYPASLWEWDDMLFARGLNNFDLTRHSPHPPGFPVFIAMVKPFFWLFKDEYVALTIVSMVFTILLAPALYYLYLEIFKDKRIAFAGALLCSFIPNVWLYGSSGRSNIPAMTVGIIGLTLVLKGIESRAALIAGCAMLGLGMGIRVTVLPAMGAMVALVFFELLRRRQFKSIALAIMTAASGYLLWFIPLILEVGWDTYKEVTDASSKYLIQYDSIWAGGRLTTRFNRFFNDFSGRSWIKVPLYLFTAVGLFALYKKGKWREILLIVVAFAPFLIFTVIMNVPYNAPLYSMPYVPFFAGLAACGLVYLPDLLSNKLPENFGFYSAIVLTAFIASWTWPIIKVRHQDVSPPIRGLEYMKNSVVRNGDTVCYGRVFEPHVDLYFPKYNKLPYQKCLEQQGGGRMIAITDIPVNGNTLAEFHWNLDKIDKKKFKRLSMGLYMDSYVTELNLKSP